MEAQRKTAMAMKPDERILNELQKLGFPWYSSQEVRTFKMRTLCPETNGVWDKDMNQIIKVFLRGVTDEEITQAKNLAQLVVDLARYAHTASRAYADLASVVSDAIMEAKTNDDDGSTCTCSTRTLARLKSTLFNSELESHDTQGAYGDLQ